MPEESGPGGKPGRGRERGEGTKQRPAPLLYCLAFTLWRTINRDESGSMQLTVGEKGREMGEGKEEEGGTVGKTVGQGVRVSF